MPDLEQRPKVTVEDLLRLKRAERPAAEFWTNFERELRQKQLSALMEKRPWWQELPQMLARRAYLPVGATAILAFTLISVKYYTPAPLAQAPLQTPSSNAPIAATPSRAVAVAPVSSPLINRSESVVVAPAEDATVAAVPTAAPASADVVELMPLLVLPRETEKPSARLLAASPSGLEKTEAELAGGILSNRLGSPARVPSPTVDELASVPVNASRRSQLLASYGGRQLNPEPAPPAVVRDRLARRLGDTETSDRSNRMVRDIDAFARPMPQIVALRF